jgi:hypothetical protein
MERRSRWIAGGAVALAVIGGGAGIAVATAVGDDQPLTGSTLDRAVDEALAATGGGTVIETEVGDGGAAYGVEVRLDDGSVVEVALDESFNVIGHETDDDGPGDADGAGDGE